MSTPTDERSAAPGDVSGAAAATRPGLLRWRDFGQKFALVVAWALVIVVFGVLRPSDYLSAANFQSMLSCCPLGCCCRW
jgi:ribose transport system permease protein